MKFLKNYAFSLLLLSSVILGGLTGFLFKNQAMVLKPFGDIFLNLLFTVVVPLVFFCIAASIASIESLRRLGSIIISMMGVFLFMGIIAAVYMLIVTAFFPPGNGFPSATLLQANAAQPLPSGNHFTHFGDLLTVSDFPKLFSRENLLALIIFAVFTGCAVSSIGEKGKPFLHFLQSGMAVFMKLTAWIMYYAPIGFFAYFAVLIGQWGQDLIGAYCRIGCIYYIAAFIYFIVGFTFFVWLARGRKGIMTFWKNMLPPAVTAFATCSSAASLPMNLEAAEQMNIRSEIYNTVIPLGTMIHKQGSILGGIVKITFLFSFFHLPFMDYSSWMMAIGVGLLVGTVMGAIPSGGMLGEMLILSVYGFPKEALMLIAVISLIIDPPATLLNVMGNTVSSLLVERINRVRP
jgi:Na+/H+-dicarboxylate symporter